MNTKENQPLSIVITKEARAVAFYLLVAIIFSLGGVIFYLVQAEETKRICIQTTQKVLECGL